MPDCKSGFRYRYCVKKTDGKGLGVFAREAIKQGSVVCRHVPGLYIVYDESSFKAMIERMPPAEVVYQPRLFLLLVISKVAGKAKP